MAFGLQDFGKWGTNLLDKAPKGMRRERERERERERWGERERGREGEGERERERRFVPA